MADQNQIVSLRIIAIHFVMDFDDERARRVDHLQIGVDSPPPIPTLATPWALKITTDPSGTSPTLPQTPRPFWRKAFTTWRLWTIS